MAKHNIENKEKDEKKENTEKVFKKWWFWVCMVAIALIIGFVVIMGIGFRYATTGIHEVALKVQSIDNEATLYSSSGGNTVVVEMPHYSDDTKKDKQEDIKQTIKQYSSKGGILENYSKFIFIKKSDSEGKKDYFYYVSTYSLPDMTEISDEGKTYIDFVQFYVESMGKNSNSTSTKSDSSTTNSSSTVSDKGENITLTAGNYVVGEDIKAGKYDAIAQSGSGNFYVEGSTSVIESMGTTDSSFYLKNYNNITLKNGDKVEVTSRLKLLLQAK